MNKSEQVILQIQQTLRTLSNKDTYQLVTIKTVSSVKGLVQKRLTQELITDVYMKDIDPSETENHPGIMIVKDLKKAALNIELAEALAKSIHATVDTPEYKASTLISAAQAIQAGGLQIFAQLYWKKIQHNIGAHEIQIKYSNTKYV